MSTSASTPSNKNVVLGLLGRADTTIASPYAKRIRLYAGATVNCGCGSPHLMAPMPHARASLGMSTPRDAQGELQLITF